MKEQSQNYPKKKPASLFTPDLSSELVLGRFYHLEKLIFKLEYIVFFKNQH